MSKQSYKELKHQLDEVLEKMQDPETELDEALELHAKGKKLVALLESYLEEVEQKVVKATKK